MHVASNYKFLLVAGAVVLGMVVYAHSHHTPLSPMLP